MAKYQRKKPRGYIKPEFYPRSRLRHDQPLSEPASYFVAAQSATNTIARQYRIRANAVTILVLCREIFADHGYITTELINNYANRLDLSFHSIPAIRLYVIELCRRDLLNPLKKGKYQYTKYQITNYGNTLLSRIVREFHKVIKDFFTP